MPDIVYVDDETDGFLAHASPAERQRFAPCTYRDDDPPQLAGGANALVWLFDFFLKEGPEGNGVAGSDDENGLSFLQKWRRGTAGRPTTVLISSKLADAVGEPVGPLERHHVVARRQGVEWIGDKSRETLTRVIVLADAAAAVSQALGTPDAQGHVEGYNLESLASKVLMVPDNVTWAPSAKRQIDEARPPRVTKTAKAMAIREVVSWLIGHVLPYPSFLLSDAQVAVRLGVSPLSFNVASVQVLVAPALYTGPLGEFLGRRWWRAGIDEIAWEHSRAEGGYRVQFESRAGDAVVWLDQAEPVLLSDADLVETKYVAEARDCVRATDEDFPANVDPAWVLIEEARADRLLRAKVIFEDRQRLDAK